MPRGKHFTGFHGSDLLVWLPGIYSERNSDVIIQPIRKC